MFTGIVEEIGQILKKSSSHRGIEWSISASANFLQDVKLGDSINVAGVCQTVTHKSPTTFSFYSSPLTLNKTTLKDYTLHQSVNLEKALQIGHRLGGHFVYGHVEGKGQILSLQPNGESLSIIIKTPEILSSLLIPEGSLSIDGVSLTISKIKALEAEVQVIPHTLKQTTLGFLRKNDFVNLETDPLAKMVARFLKTTSSSKSPSFLEKTLQENGWI